MEDTDKYSGHILGGVAGGWGIVRARCVSRFEFIGSDSPILSLGQLASTVRFGCLFSPPHPSPSQPAPAYICVEGAFRGFRVSNLVS